MSITLSLPLVASRLQRRLMDGFGGLCLLVGAAAAAGFLAPLHWPLATVLACTGAGVAVLLAARRRPTARTLDLLGPGTLVLTVQQGTGSPTRLQVTLLAESTLWPQLLVLRLQAGQAKVPALLLFADSVPPGTLRRLAMALRAMAMRPAEK